MINNNSNNEYDNNKTSNNKTSSSNQEKKKGLKKLRVEKENENKKIWTVRVYATLYEISRYTINEGNSLKIWIFFG